MARARVFSDDRIMPTCCRRPMSVIEVTSPLDVDAAKLALHSCASCERHLWVRDGLPLDKDDVLSAFTVHGS